MSKATNSTQAIRHALHIGLNSYGEIERLVDMHQVLSMHSPVPPDAGLKPIHPTGAPDTIGVFASALRLLDDIEAPAVQPSANLQRPHTDYFEPDAERIDVALCAIYQAEDLIKAMVKACDGHEIDNVVIGISARLQDLFLAVVAVLTDGTENTSKLAEVVHGHAFKGGNHV